MVWKSVVFMTIIDIVIISLVFSAFVFFYISLETIKKLKIFSGLSFAMLGLLTIALFYFADLLAMHLFPLFMPMGKAMEFMRELHINYIWIVFVIAVIFLVIGLIYLFKSLLPKIETFIQKIQRSEHQIKVLLDSTVEGIFGCDLDGNCTWANPACITMIGYDSIDELLGANMHAIMHRTHHDGMQCTIPECCINKVLCEGEFVHCEHETLYRKNGTNFPVEYWSYPILQDNGLTGVVTTFIDISERKQAEMQITQALDEKTILLREIHHRVKNNLMIVSTLLEFQENQITDKAIIELFKSAQRRIDSMALIHNLLYQSNNLAEIDFTAYIHELVTHLVASFHRFPVALSLEVDDDISLSIETATHCGLLINELVFNAMKHAFVENMSGKLNIVFQRQAYARYKLIVSDNGCGIPAEIDWQNTKSLGLQLVNMLITQLRGTITINRTQGTTFNIAFKELKYEKRL